MNLLPVAMQFTCLLANDCFSRFGIQGTLKLAGGSYESPNAQHCGVNGLLGVCSDHVNCAHEEVVYLDERSGSYVTCAACQKEVTVPSRNHMSSLTPLFFGCLLHCKL